jgi:integrase
MPVKKKRTPWTADQWVKEWTTNPEFQRPSQATNDANAERVQRLAVDFKGVPLSEITTEQAKEWAEQYPGRVAAVKTMLNDARRQGIIPFNPFSGTVPAREPKEPARLTEAEVRELASTGYELFPGWPVMGALILTTAYTGMGIGELGALQWHNLDWERGVINVERQFRPRQQEFVPTRKAREIALPEVVLEALRALPRLGQDDLIFYSTRSRGVYYSQLHTFFWLQVRAAFLARLAPERREEIGPGLDFNDLRYFTAQFLSESGVDPRDAANQLGVTVKRLEQMYDPSTDGAADRVRAAFRSRALSRAV